jgi:hypothetical protein
MSNVNNPRGLSPVGGITGGPYTGRISRYYVPATDGTAIYLGGLVKPAGSADESGVMSVTGNVSTGNPVIGVVVAVEPVTRDSEIYRVASTARYVLVADDPNAIFEVQANGVGLAVTDIGTAADLTGFTTGSTATGLSTTQISTIACTAAGDGTEDVLILGLSPRIGNSTGTYSKAYVRLNNHYLVDGSAGA